jgi:ABC-type transporter Mla subunit MlaD
VATSKKDERSSLAQAVDALEDELRELDRHTDAALKHELNSEKHLQQVASSMGAIGARESRLRGAMERLMGALNELGTRQQRQMDVASQRANELQARHEVFQALMQRYASLGAAAQELQAHLVKLAEVPADGEAPAEALPAILEKLAGLVAEAEGLESQSEKDNFIDLVRYARSLRQQLASAHTTMTRRLEKLPRPQPTDDAATASKS